MRVHVRRRLTAPLLLQDWVIRRKLSLCSNHFKKREREKRKSRPTLIVTVKKSSACTITHSLAAQNKIHQLLKIQLLWGRRVKLVPFWHENSYFLVTVFRFQQAMHIS